VNKGALRWANSVPHPFWSTLLIALAPVSEYLSHRARPEIPQVGGEQYRKGFLEDAQYRKLIEHCPELWFRALAECGRIYGWRVSELLTMRVSQVDVSQRVIRLEPGRTKNRDGREVMMTETVCQLLSALVHDKAADDFVFTRANGKPVRDFRVKWQNACVHAGVPDLLFHDLRRTGARNLRRAGVAEGIIMKIGGWRTRSVFERYAIVSRSDEPRDSQVAGIGEASRA